MRFKVPGVLFLFLLLLSGCKKEDPNTLVVVPAKLEIPKEGGVATFTIETDAGSWSIENQASGWLTLSVTKGTENKVVVTATVSTSCAEARVDTLIVTAGTATPAKIVVTQPPAEFLYSLTTNHSRLEFESKGSTSGLTITTDAPQWSIASDAGWIRFSQASGEKGTSSVDVIATKNTVDNVRSATITISAPSAPVVRVTVSQEGDIYPSYNSSPLAPDASGMSSTASELAAKIGLGWNIGNTLEAIGGETAWGNPLVTKELIDLVKKNGFNAIRIPCSWNQHMVDSTTAEIKEEWLDRVKEVVQYCVDDDLYVLLNIHWDGGWLENNCTEVKQDANNSKQRAFWEQIATHLRDFDEHLLFASANEPNVSSPEGMEVLNSYHQTFVDAVRSTGGRNSYRVLVVQGPSTDIEKTNSLMTTLPSDSAENRLMVEVHYYTPWNFCGLEEDASWGKMFYYWGKSYH
ncbi:MAG TPA: cellulase family glycosylhydrolase, partial [Prolixibacteraceae bacterium]|nr:cellulase family glycosylhydrolase [Prolixibacteraceae bacterium]